MIRPTTALAILTIVSVFLGPAPTEAADLTPVLLKCEYAANPIGVDVARPRFSWVLKSARRGQVQTAYQILVASSQQKLQADAGDKWDSGQVNSDRSVKIAYQGKALTSRERCWWKIRAWDKEGKASAYSAPATFEMGLLQRSDWKGKWIAMGDIDGDLVDAPEGQTKIAIRANTSPAPMFRKEFEIDGEIPQARVYASGLGYCQLYVNGKRVGDRVLDPATSYCNNDQPYEMPSRVLYVTYDVTDFPAVCHHILDFYARVLAFLY
jgi:alpha-L-rhamnosidase